MNYIVQYTDWDDLINFPIMSQDGKSSCYAYIYKEDKTTMYLGNLYVSEDERGKGRGKDILNYVRKLAEEKGCNQLILKVKINGWVREWYEKEGFELYSIDEEEPDVYVWYEKKIILTN